MEAAPREASDVRGSIASVEGYLALALLGLGFLVPSVDHPSKERAIGAAVYFGVAFGLAVGGVRFGKGGGRFAAGAALVVLSLMLLALLAASIEHWDLVLWYWRH